MTKWYARPVFFVADVARSVEFYTTKLGFRESWNHKQDEQVLVAQVDRAECELIFSSQWPEIISDQSL